MSYQLKTSSLVVGTSVLDLYTCGGDNAVVFGLSLTSNQASDITINVSLYSDSEGTTVDIVSPDTILEPGETLVPIGGIQKLVMKTDDIIKVSCSVSSGLDAICSAMELNDYV